VYQIGTHSKLKYISGNRSPKEYAELWSSILKPLLECGDWFMNPCSFVLSIEHLYYDKNSNAVSYVYIPSTIGCSGYDALKEMAADVSKMMIVSDAALENKVLKAIMNDFNPNEFLLMLKALTAADTSTLPHIPEYTQVKADELRVASPVMEFNANTNTAYSPEIESPEALDNCFTDSIFEPMEDIVFDITPQKKTGSNGSEKKKGHKHKIFGNRSIRKKEQKREVPLCSETAPAAVSPMVPAFTEISEITQNTPVMIDGTGLRYIGHAHLPQAIKIVISEGEVFTIGRYDAAIGKQQSSFEFDKKTKAVSRRHAVIERDIEGYKIIDLSSSAGTFVDNQKLPPNTPFGLVTGCRVSFGNSGADYVWEAS
jgi:hypothetical protein